MIHHYSARLGNLRLRPLAERDIEALRQWRNDTETTKFLRNIGHITPEMQKKWFESYLQNPEDVLFAIEETEELGVMVGSVALYEWDRDRRQCEIGKIQIGVPAAHGKGIGKKALVMAMKIAFRQMGIQKLVAEVHPDNIQAYKNDMKVGFRIIGEQDSIFGGREYLLEMDEQDAARANSYYGEITTDCDERKEQPC